MWKGNWLAGCRGAHWLQGKAGGSGLEQTAPEGAGNLCQSDLGTPGKMTQFRTFLPSLHCSAQKWVSGHSNWMCLRLVPISWLYPLATDGRTSRDLFGFYKLRAVFLDCHFFKTAHKREEAISHKGGVVFLRRESKDFLLYHIFQKGKYEPQLPATIITTYA